MEVNLTMDATASATMYAYMYVSYLPSRAALASQPEHCSNVPCWVSHADHRMTKPMAVMETLCDMLAGFHTEQARLNEERKQGHMARLREKHQHDLARMQHENRALQESLNKLQQEREVLRHELAVCAQVVTCRAAANAGLGAHAHTRCCMPCRPMQSAMLLNSRPWHLSMARAEVFAVHRQACLRASMPVKLLAVRQTRTRLARHIVDLAVTHRLGGAL